MAAKIAKRTSAVHEVSARKPEKAFLCELREPFAILAVKSFL
jgi:hypothetical protein